MQKIVNKRSIQERQYQFPYHYIPNYRNGFSQTLNWTWGINYVSTLEFLIEKLKKVKFKSLCDIGTGDGRLVKELSEIFPKKEILGIDYSQKAINLAKTLNPTLTFIKADIINDKIGKKFDILTLVEVFEHISLLETNKFIKALYN
ncbi:class I SAM-dependent methyltransferase, partial [bacterium]|nr:class I SAM-dependent methyltransferase [bacterium]